MKKKSLLQPMDSQPSVSMKSLRQLAEEKLREKIIEDKQSRKVLSADDVKQMLYDLELQQIQLELQNAEIESLRQRLDALQHTTSGQVLDQRLAESILTTKTELLEVTGQLAKVGGWEFDLLRNSLYWTAETYRIHELEEHVEPSLAQAIHFYESSAQPIIQEAVKEGIEQGKSWRLELPLITAKGRAIWVLAQGFAVVENGKTIKLIGAFQDITERKNSEAEG